MNNDIIFYNISKFLCFNEYKNVSLINFNIRKNLICNIPYHIKIEYSSKKLIKDGYPLNLLKVLNPIKLYKVPIYPQKIFRGCTDYIDYIDSTYFINTFIIRGKDELNRPYISFHYNNKVTTLFQRYSNNKYKWVSGGENDYMNNIFLYDFLNNYLKNDPLIIKLIELLNNI